MEFNIYKDADQFQIDINEIITEDELLNNLLIKNIENAYKNQNVFMATVTHNQKIIAVCDMSPSFPLVLYFIQNQPDDELLCFLALSFFENKICFKEIMCVEDISERFAVKYSKISGLTYGLEEKLNLYYLEEVAQISNIKGDFVEISEDDLFYLPYWFAAFAPACHIGSYNLQDNIKTFERFLNQGKAFLWKDGSPRSLAVNTRSTDNYAIIGYVYTPPMFQGQGYAKACVSNLCKLLLQKFKYCALYANAGNPRSNAVYKSIGFKLAFVVDKYKFM